MKTVALLLCSIVLLSSFGLTLNMHLCQGKVKTISFLGEAQKCVEMNEMDHCKIESKSVSFTKKKCCSDASVKAETSTQNIPVINNQVENLVLGINPYVKLIPTSVPGIESDVFHYNPPPDKHSGRVLLELHQTFLI